jgi:type I restriction enzyme S subunit
MKNNNNNLPKGWRKVKLGEIVNVSGGGTPSTSNPKYWGGNIPWLTPAEVVGLNGNRFIYKTERYITEEGLKNSSAKVMPANSLLLTSRATIGEVVINKVPMATNQGFINIEPKEVDLMFLFYWLKNNRKFLNQMAIGSTFNELSKSVFKKIDILIPEDINEQKRIADILSSFDDKIEVNNKIIKILEEMAQEIFKEWFVRFRFPYWEKVKFVDSELGKIPEGWEVGYLGDGIYSEIIKPKVKKFEGEKIYLATADVEKNEIVNEKTKISYNNRPIRANMEPVLNSIWFAKMINTYKVLFFFEGNKDDIAKYILSTGFMGIKALKNMQYYLYLFINSKEFHHMKDTLVQGAVQEAITNTNVKQIKFLVPPENLLDEFNKKVEPLLIKAYKLRKENQTLTALRDLLLPKLMSGEIRV